jgi:hypothetical protein
MIKARLLSNLIIIGIVLLSLSCSSTKKIKSENKTTCNENLVFKKQFIDNIKNVENLILEVQGDSIKNSLKFIGKYTHVSFETMMNYAHTYPYGVFLEDKKVWLKWYEENKCKNIQFKE